jgi:hypothetical protein
MLNDDYYLGKYVIAVNIEARHVLRSRAYYVFNKSRKRAYLKPNDFFSCQFSKLGPSSHEVCYSTFKSNSNVWSPTLQISSQLTKLSPLSGRLQQLDPPPPLSDPIVIKNYYCDSMLARYKHIIVILNRLT